MTRKSQKNQRIVETRIVIQTDNGQQRVQYIQDLASATGGTRFIPHFTQCQQLAKDFLTIDHATQVLQLLHPGAMRGEFQILPLDIYGTTKNGYHKNGSTQPVQLDPETRKIFSSHPGHNE